MSRALDFDPRPLLALLVVGFCLSLAGSANAAWRRAATPHFIIYGVNSESSLRDFAIRMERFDYALRRRFGFGDDAEPEKLTIYVVTDEGAVQELMPGDRRNAIGVYFAAPEGAFAAVSLKGYDDDSLSPDLVLFHEYTHHFMYRYFRTAFPNWYTEGFAEFMATTAFTKEGRVKVGLPAQHRAAGLLGFAPPPIERLLTQSTKDLSPTAGDVFYGRAWLLVHFLTLDPARHGQLTAYLQRLTAGESSLDAARETFGDLKILDKDLDHYQSGRLGYTTSVDIIPTPADFPVTELDPADSELVHLQLRERAIRNVFKLAPTLTATRRFVHEHPDNLNGQCLLANLEYTMWAFDRADASVDAALAINPKFSRALLLKGLIKEAQLIRNRTTAPEAWKSERSWLIRANNADVNDPLPLIFYYNSWLEAGLTPPENAFSGLKTAYSMIPEVGWARMSYAQALILRKSFAEAAQIIAPLANAPHDNGWSKSAQTLLARVNLAIKSGVMPPEAPTAGQQAP